MFAGYALLAVGLAIMVLSDLSLAKCGRRNWIHLSEKERVFYGRASDNQVQELVASLQLWLPILGIVHSYFLYDSTVDIVIGLSLPDLWVAVGYMGAFLMLSWAPNFVVYAIGTRHARRLAAMVASGPPASDGSRHDAEDFWRSVLGSGHMTAGVGVAGIIGQPFWLGIPCGLFLASRRFKHRKEHLEKCRSVGFQKARSPDP